MGQVQTGPTRVQFGIAANYGHHHPHLHQQRRRHGSADPSLLSGKPKGEKEGEAGDDDPALIAGGSDGVVHVVRERRGSGGGSIVGIKKGKRGAKALDEGQKRLLGASLRAAYREAIAHPCEFRYVSHFGVQVEACYREGLWDSVDPSKDWINEFDKLSSAVLAAGTSEDNVTKLNTLKAHILIASGEIDEALDLLRAKFQNHPDALSAHALIEALGLFNTRSATKEIVQVAKSVRPNLYTTDEVASVLTVMMQQILYKWPKDALSVQDQKFYQAIKHQREAAKLGLQQQGGSSSLPVETVQHRHLHPREVSVTVYNPTEEAVMLSFDSPHHSVDENESVAAHDYKSFMLSTGDKISIAGHPVAAIVAQQNRHLHTKLDSTGTAFTAIEILQSPQEREREKVEKEKREKEREEDEVGSWRSEVVGDWMTDLHLTGDYKEAFRENRVDGRRLLELQKADLLALGVAGGHDLDKVARGIEELKLRPSMDGLKHVGDLNTDM